MNEWVLLLIVGLPLLALWIRAGAEVILRPELPTTKRLIWIAALVLLPVLGLAAYIVTRTPPESIRGEVDADSSRAEQIVQLAEERQRGELDDEAFHRQIRSLDLRSAQPEQASA